MNRAERIKEYQDNFEYYVNELMKYPDAKLVSKLEVVRMQIELTIKNKDEEAYETLSWWERHIIEARIRKCDLPEEAPYFDEIEEAIKDIETIVIKAEERKEIIEGTTFNSPASKPKIQQDNSNQTSLF